MHASPQSGPGLIIRLIVLTCISVALMTLDHRFQHLQAVRSKLAILIYPLQLAVDLPAQAMNSITQSWNSEEELEDINQQLHRDKLHLLARIQKLEIFEAENKRLRELLHSSSKISDQVLVAELLSVDLDPYKQQIVIDKGKSDDVYVGQPLIDAHGIMGQVAHIAAYSSTVLLISDPNHAIPVQLTRNGLRSVAAGTGKSDQLELLFIPSTADVQVGDQITSSGLGGRFPRDYPVAEIISIEHPPGQPFAKVIAKPRAELDRNREVLLVWHGKAPTAGAFTP